VPAKPPEDREQGRSGKKNQAEERHDLSIPHQRLSEVFQKGKNVFTFLEYFGKSLMRNG